MFGTRSGKYVHWNRKSLKRLTIADLVSLAVCRRSTRKSFKQVVVDYLIEIGPWTK